MPPAAGGSWPRTRRPSPISSRRAATCSALGLDQAGGQLLPALQGRHDAGRAHCLLLRAAAGSSLLSGVAPADVHNRDPRKLPLVSAGAMSRRWRAGPGAECQCGLLPVPAHTRSPPGREPRIPTSNSTCGGPTAARPSPSRACWPTWGSPHRRRCCPVSRPGGRRPGQGRPRRRGPMVAGSLPGPAPGLGRSVPLLPLVNAMNHETMSSRQRVLAALNHQVPDRVPIDLGGNQTGIHKFAYQAVAKTLGTGRLRGDHGRRAAACPAERGPAGAVPRRYAVRRRGRGGRFPGRHRPAAARRPASGTT